ncbi:hypothetical protein CapIbe_008983 [Capra ibex]
MWGKENTLRLQNRALSNRAAYLEVERECGTQAMCAEKSQCLTSHDSLISGARSCCVSSAPSTILRPSGNYRPSMEEETRHVLCYRCCI